MTDAKVAFITLTNEGYLPYTLNCLESLKRINFQKQLVCYAIGSKAHVMLVERGISAVELESEEENNTKFQSFRTGNWHHVTFYKFEIIFDNLQNHDFVLFTDGDIVFENPKVLEYCLENIGDHDMLIQNDTQTDDSDANLCSGFMFIKSNVNTLKMFSPDYVRKVSEIVESWDDQVYMNMNKSELDIKRLPLALFPNGAYYQTHKKELTPYIIHFNYLLGHRKAFSILRHGKYMSRELFFQFFRMMDFDVYKWLVVSRLKQLLSFFGKT